MWQFALFALLSLVSGLITSSLLRQKKSEPDWDYSDQPIWVDANGLAIGDKRLSKVGLFFRKQYSDIFFDHFSSIAASKSVLLRQEQLKASYYKPKLEGILPFWSGISEGADLEFDLARDGPHALIVGSTGSGKSEFLKLITGSMLTVNPSNLRLILIDFKGGAALEKYLHHPSALTLVTDIDSSEQERFWLYLQGELKFREQLLAQKKLSSILECPGLNRMLVLADELPAILSSNPLATVTLDAIAARGRSLGVHLIATSQSLSGIPRSLITNLNLRFALGVSDPGDLVALMPTVRPGSIGQSRALAILGAKSFGFDFPMVQQLPGIGEAKFNLQEAINWGVGLAKDYEPRLDVLAMIDLPLEHQILELKHNRFNNGSVLLVGASASGKTWFCERMRELAPDALVLDEPSIDHLQQNLDSGQQVFCALSSTQVIPLAVQRKFEHVIYLRQGTFEQHLAAGLPKTQWQETLPPGRGWYRNLVIQLVRPTQIPAKRAQESELQQLGH
ncbi:MAG: hypothetical protein RIQ88_640 [Actinomycetota bacterium]